MCILRATAAGGMTADRGEHAMVVVVLQLHDTAIRRDSVLSMVHTSTYRSHLSLNSIWRWYVRACRYNIHVCTLLC